MEWNEAAYRKALKRANGLTDKGCRIALNQADSMTAEAVEAYRDVLRERGWSDSELMPSAETVVYDYANQAWIRDGRYERCGHPESMDCRCYGKEHAGEIAELS